MGSRISSGPLSFSSILRAPLSASRSLASNAAPVWPPGSSQGRDARQQRLEAVVAVPDASVKGPERRGDAVALEAAQVRVVKGRRPVSRVADVVVEELLGGWEEAGKLKVDEAGDAWGLAGDEDVAGREVVVGEDVWARAGAFAFRSHRELQVWELFGDEGSDGRCEGSYWSVGG